jgi:hypothetical protein
MSYLIGPKKSQLLYDKLGDRGGQAFEAMSSYDFESLPKGIYKGDVDKFRQRMNLGRGEKLKVVTSE